jgi:hypothetical protein
MKASNEEVATARETIAGSFVVDLGTTERTRLLASDQSPQRIRYRVSGSIQRGDPIDHARASERGTDGHISIPKRCSMAASGKRARSPNKASHEMVTIGRTRVGGARVFYFRTQPHRP